MMGKKKLSEVKAQLAALSVRRPAKAEPANGDKKRVVETLEALCAELEQAAKTPRKPKSRRQTAKR
jgi:hypothetical protein